MHSNKYSRTEWQISLGLTVKTNHLKLLLKVKSCLIISYNCCHMHNTVLSPPWIIVTDKSKVINSVSGFFERHFWVFKDQGHIFWMIQYDGLLLHVVLSKYEQNLSVSPIWFFKWPWCSRSLRGQGSIIQNVVMFSQYSVNFCHMN